jgi:hypothetical protein
MPQILACNIMEKQILINFVGLIELRKKKKSKFSKKHFCYGLMYGIEPVIIYMLTLFKVSLFLRHN